MDNEQMKLIVLSNKSYDQIREDVHTVIQWPIWIVLSKKSLILVSLIST